MPADAVVQFQPSDGYYRSNAVVGAVGDACPIFRGSSNTAMWHVAVPVGEPYTESDVVTLADSQDLTSAPGLLAHMKHHPPSIAKNCDVWKVFFPSSSDAVK